MVCVFFGHRLAPIGLKKYLREAVARMIEDNGVSNFYVGNNGGFDGMVQNVLEDIAKHRRDFSYSIVLSRVDEKPLNGCQNRTLFPEGLEFALPRFAICKRNEWMLKQADAAIVYMVNKISNCSRWVERAEKKGCQIIYLPLVDSSYN